MNQLQEFIDSNDKTKLAVIVLSDNNRRRLVHQYLDKTTKLKHVGFYCNSFTADMVARFIKCYLCEQSLKIKDEDYRRGVLENNKDEYYYIRCEKCGEGFTWEPNYDNYDNIKVLYANNVIVIGDYMKHNNKPTHAVDKDVSINEISSYIKDVYIIETPNKLLDKRKLQNYINEKVEHQINKK